MSDLYLIIAIIIVGALITQLLRPRTAKEPYRPPHADVMEIAIAKGEAGLARMYARDQVQVSAAAEMLHGSHHAIFTAHGERLGQTDIFSSADMAEVAASERQVAAAWQVAKTHARNTYGNRAYQGALRNLGLN